MEIKTIQTEKINLKADPTQLLEYVFYLKAQMKLLEEELRDNEELVMAIIESNNGSVSMESNEISGKATVCTTKSYIYSDAVSELVAKKKVIETNIKAKQMVEIACGAQVESVKKYIRYNVEFK